MPGPTEKDLHTVVSNTKDLGIYGFADAEYRKQHKRVNLKQEREDLRNDFENFKLCCEWFSQCRTTKNATEKSLGCRDLKALIEDHFDASIPNGTLIAAVLFLEIPYKSYSGTQDITVGISRACPFYKEQADRFFL